MIIIVMETFDTILLLWSIMTSLLFVPHPAGAWCDFDEKMQYEEKPCGSWQMPYASDNSPGFVIHRTGRLSWNLQPQANDSTGNYVGKY